MGKKTNLGIFFGGRSCEHEVSVASAQSIINAIDRDIYNLHLVGIDKSGRWHLDNEISPLLSQKQVKALDSMSNTSNLVTLDLYHEGNLTHTGQADAPGLDVIFPVLHGTFGEDGTIQGVFEMAGLPYIGCGVAASAIAMDKALAKQIFSAAGIPQAPCQVVLRSEWKRDRNTVCQRLEQLLGLPIFTKPANMGSSVGVSKAHDTSSLEQAISLAFEYDNKVIVEQSMENCHEVECAVLGNENPDASAVGEIIPGAEFYDYQTKYIDDKSDTLIPARISDAATKRVQELSIRAFEAIDGSGLARVDFFVHKETEEVYLNEINTLPGFTPISMYPKLWAASGIAYSDLINKLVELAFERHQSRASLKRAF